MSKCSGSEGGVRKISVPDPRKDDTRKSCAQLKALSRGSKELSQISFCRSVMRCHAGVALGGSLLSCHLFFLFVSMLQKSSWECFFVVPPVWVSDLDILGSRAK